METIILIVGTLGWICIVIWLIWLAKESRKVGKLEKQIADMKQIRNWGAALVRDIEDISIARYGVWRTECENLKRENEGNKIALSDMIQERTELLSHVENRDILLTRGRAVIKEYRQMNYRLHEQISKLNDINDQSQVEIDRLQKKVMELLPNTFLPDMAAAIMNGEVNPYRGNESLINPVIFEHSGQVNYKK